MKKLIFFIAIIFISIPFMVISGPSETAATVEGFSISQIFDYLVTNWISISLIISELAALLSVKYSGILKTIVTIGDLIFKKKKGSSDLSSKGLNGLNN